jgi:hypothetical protein
MERATRDLVEGGFGLGALSPQELEQLFRLLRKVRLDADDFDDDLARELDDDIAQDPAEHVAPDHPDGGAASSTSSVTTPSRGVTATPAAPGRDIY